MNIINRIFFRFYQFYSRIEQDKVMVYYFSAFAISFLLAFYILLIIALFYKLTTIKLIKISGFSLTVLFAVIICISLFFFYRNKKILLENIKDMKPIVIYEDILVWAFTIFSIVSLFIGGMILI